MMTSCIIYHPQMADIPLIAKKGDVRIDAGISIIPSAHATVSYGLTDKITIQGFGSIGEDEKYYLQGATGIYKNINESRVLEAYAGFGYGHGKTFHGGDNGRLYGNYQLYFGQFNFGKISRESSNFESGIGIKAGYLHSNLTDENYYDWVPENGPNRKIHDDSFLFEPAAFIRMGGKKVKFSIKLGGTYIHKFTHTDKDFPYGTLNLGLGINYRL
jgi:hypothetical protein